MRQGARLVLKSCNLQINPEAKSKALKNKTQPFAICIFLFFLRDLYFAALPT
jgi:hypothetical protein